MMRRVLTLLGFLLLASAAWAQPVTQGTLGRDTEALTMMGCVRADTAAVAAGVGDLDRARCIVDAAGRLWVNIGAGTVTATQGGTWTIQPGNTANTTPWLTSVSEGGATAQVTATGGGSLQVECSTGCGSGTQYDEDTAHSSGDKVTLAGVVRQDAVGALAADGDRSVLQVNAVGALRVAPVAEDQDTFTAGTTNAVPAAGVFDDGLSDVTSGQLATPRITADRGLHVNLRNNAGAEIAPALESGGNLAAAAASLSVVDDWDESDRAKVNVIAGQAGITGGSGTVAANTPRVVLATDVALPAGTNAIGKLAANSGVDIGDVDVLSVVPGTGATSLGKAVDSVPGATDTGVAALVVRDDALATLTPADGDYTHLRVNSRGALHVSTEDLDVAHDAADSGNPVKIGAKAETSISGATKVADGDRTNLYAGIDGVLIVRPYANLEDRVSAVVGVTDGSSTSLVAAQGAGIRFCATTIIVSNSSATNVTVDLRDGTAGSVLMTIPAAANMGGAVIPLPVPLCTTANTALAADPSAAASTVTTTAVGFKSAL